jgi:hypothetical protein
MVDLADSKSRRDLRRSEWRSAERGLCTRTSMTIDIVDPASASVLVTRGSLAIQPVEKIGKIVSIIKLKIDLRYAVHYCRLAHDRIDDCPQVTTG